MRRFLFLSLVILLSSSVLFAQFDSASVLGTVRDSTGALLSGANVTLTNLETGISAQSTTTDAGQYEFPSVQSKAPKSSFSATCFTRAVAHPIEIGAFSPRVRNMLFAPQGTL